MIDQEVHKLIEFAYHRTLDLLKERREELETLAKELLEKEILFQSDLEKLIGKRPFAKETTYQAYTNGKNKEEVKKAEDAEIKAKSEEVSTEAEEKKEVPVAESESEPETDEKAKS